MDPNDHSDYNADWARAQDRMRAEPDWTCHKPEDQPMTTVRRCEQCNGWMNAPLSVRVCLHCRLPWLASEPPLPPLPTTSLRHCANEKCISQGGRRALISDDGEHDLCTVCQKQARCRMLIAAGTYSDWPNGTAPVSDLEMQTRRDYGDEAARWSLQLRNTVSRRLDQLHWFPYWDDAA